jgi:hypothetical protein
MRPAIWIGLCLTACGLSASSQTVAVVNACVNNLNGAMRLVLSSANCINGVESFRQWNATGPQGAAGTQGPAGPSGPTGPAGGQVYESNLIAPSLMPSPSGPNNTSAFLGAVTGKDTLTIQESSADIQAHALIVPTACVARNFTVTQIGASGINSGIVGLQTANNPVGAAGFGSTSIFCSLVTNDLTGTGTISSCLSNATVALPAGTPIFISAWLPPAWVNVRFLVSFTCS